LVTQAGAAKVLAVDGSSFIAEVARKNAAANGFATGAADGGPRVLVLQVSSTSSRTSSPLP